MKNNFKKLMLLFGLTAFGLISKAQNNALDFDGVDDYVNINNISPVLAGDNTFTIEFWMKADRNAQTSSIRTTMFGINQVSNGFNRLLIILGGASAQTGQLMIYLPGSSGQTFDYISTQIIGDDECHHISVVIDNNLGSVFIDGVLDGTFTYNTTLANTDTYSLGQEYDQGGATSQFYNGTLDEVRIWNTARTQQQIIDNMDLELSGSQSGLVALYNCNQGTPSGNNTGITTLTNSTANTGLNGTLNNFSLSGNASNFVFNPCLNCEAIDNPSYTQVTSDLTISTNTVWSGKYYIGEGVTVTVDNSATLDITNVDLVFGSCAGMDFVDGGALRANNSVFRSCSIYGTWNGLYFEGANNITINNLINECTFKNAEDALMFENNVDALISNNLFSNCYVGINAINSDFHHTISGNKFVTEEFYPEFSSCTGRRSNTSYSIYANRSVFYEPVSQNEFVNSNEDITAVGFESSFGGGEFTNNSFTDLNQAINVVSALFNFNIGSNHIVKNTVDGYGIYIFNSSGSLIEINDNILTNHQYQNVTENGIYLDRAFFVSVANNQIEGFNTGIYAYNSDNLQIINNVITNARNIGIAYERETYVSGNTNYITCNEIKMNNFKGTGIYVQNMTWTSLIATNCIFDSKMAIDLLNTTNSNLLLPKIRNNYLYNYTSAGINVDGFGGNIGSTNALDQGMNTFWSNTFNSSVDIQSNNPITAAYNFGIANISAQVTIEGESQYHSTASCANQIEFNTNGVNSLLVEDYQCDNISLVVDMIGNGGSGGGESSFIDNSISGIEEAVNPFMLSSAIIGYFDEINEQQLNQILSASSFTSNEELLLKYQYYYKHKDYENAKLAINNYSPEDEKGVDFKTVCLIDIKSIELGWDSVSEEERISLTEIINENSEFSNIAISLNNHVSSYQPYQISTIEARNIESSSEVINLESYTEILSIYPSPTKGMVTIDIINLNENDKLTIYDVTGKIVMNYSISFSTGKLQLNVEDFEKGVYFVSIQDSKSGAIRKGKFVKI